MEFREVLRPLGFHMDITELETLITLVKERVNFVKEIWDQTDFFFRAPEAYDQEVIKKRWREDSPAVLSELKELLENIDDFTQANTESAVKSWIEQKGYNTGNVMTVFRLVIVGTSRGPHIFDIIAWIGREETLRRIQNGINVIGK